MVCAAERFFLILMIYLFTKAFCTCGCYSRLDEHKSIRLADASVKIERLGEIGGGKTSSRLFH